MNNSKTRLGPGCALNFFVTSEMKEALQSAARAQGINVADLVRLSLRAMLPLFEALGQTQEILLKELIERQAGQFRKRHGICRETIEGECD